MSEEKIGMNVIKAWDTAEVGQKIKRAGQGFDSYLKESDDEFVDFFSSLSEEEKYSNDWVRVISRNKHVPVNKSFTANVTWEESEDGFVVPVVDCDSDISDVDVDFEQLIGKSTKMTVEWSE